MTAGRRRALAGAGPRPALLALAVVVVTVTIMSLGGSAGATTRCFGAAARDASLGCSNATRSATPGLDDVEAGAPCRPVSAGLDSACAFGVSASRAARTIALIGDSHAMNWRAAVDVVARDRRWRGYSMASPGCVYSTAAAALPDGRREHCVRWYRSVSRWLGRHPEVSTVFVSQNAALPIMPGPGRTYASTTVDGYSRTWAALPSTITKVIVLRDTPDPSDDTLRCLRRVIAAGRQRPGPACATPRSQALRWDPAVFAAARLNSRRYRTIDLTNFFCGRRDCYPVIGGVRVFSDVGGHFTTTFSRTLGPYLLRDVRGLFESW